MYGAATLNHLDIRFDLLLSPGVNVFEKEKHKDKISNQPYTQHILISILKVKGFMLQVPVLNHIHEKFCVNVPAVLSYTINNIADTL